MGNITVKIDYSAWAYKGKRVTVNMGLLSGAMGKIKSVNHKQNTAVIEFSLLPHKNSCLWVDRLSTGVMNLDTSQLGELTITAVMTINLAHLTPFYSVSSREV